LESPQTRSYEKKRNSETFGLALSGEGSLIEEYTTISPETITLTGAARGSLLGISRSILVSESGSENQNLGNFARHGQFIKQIPLGQERISSGIFECRRVKQKPVLEAIATW